MESIRSESDEKTEWGANWWVSECGYLWLGFLVVGLMG